MKKTALLTIFTLAALAMPKMAFSEPNQTSSPTTTPTKTTTVVDGNVFFRFVELTPTSVTLLFSVYGRADTCTLQLVFGSAPVPDSLLKSSITLSTNDSIIHFDSLIANQHYHIYLRTICEATDTMFDTWYHSDFWTPCEPLSHIDINFTEDFQPYTDSTFAELFTMDCWRRSDSTIVLPHHNDYDSNRYLKMVNLSWFSIPPIDSLSDLEISFDVDRFGNEGTLYVGVLENSNDFGSFVPIQMVRVHRNYSPYRNWNHTSVRLARYHGIGNSVAFFFITNSDTLYIDNIDVHPATGCPNVDRISARNINFTSATLSWNDPEWTGSYLLILSHMEPSDSTIITDTIFTSDTTMTLTNLIPDCDYLARVFIVCGDSNTSTGRGLQIHTPNIPTVCLAPISVTVNDITRNTARVSWTPQGDESLWELHVMGAGVDTLFDCNDTERIINGLTQNTEYGIVVRPVCYDSTMAWSDTVTFITNQCPPITSIEITDITLHTASVIWQASNFGPWQIIYAPHGSMQDEGVSLLLTHNDVSGTETVHYTLEGLDANTTYDLCIRTLCSDEETSPWSDTIAFTTQQCDPVTSVNVNNITAHSALVSWQSHNDGPWQISYGPSGFTPDEGTMLRITSYDVTGSGTVSYSLYDLQPDSTYDLYIRAFCSDEDPSAWSSKLTFKTSTEGINNSQLSFFSSQFSIYPNPTTGKVTIQVHNSNLRIQDYFLTDMMGRRKEVRLTPIGSNQYTLDLTPLPKATYLLTITTFDGHQHTVRLLKQ